MARRAEPKVPRFPEPPWTYSPAEVGEWIRRTHPSGRRTRKAVRKGSETVTRLRFSVVEAEAAEVRAALREALSGIGLAMAGEPRRGEAAPRHRAVARVRRGLLGPKVRVSVEFLPPIHPSSERRLMESLVRALRVENVEAKEERPRMPPATRKGGRA